jgi:hypothetical protein
MPHESQSGTPIEGGGPLKDDLTRTRAQWADAKTLAEVRSFISAEYIDEWDSLILQLKSTLHLKSEHDQDDERRLISELLLISEPQHDTPQSQWNDIDWKSSGLVSDAHSISSVPSPSGAASPAETSVPPGFEAGTGDQLGLYHDGKSWYEFKDGQMLLASSRQAEETAHSISSVPSPSRAASPAETSVPPGFDEGQDGAVVMHLNEMDASLDEIYDRMSLSEEDAARFKKVHKDLLRQFPALKDVNPFEIADDLLNIDQELDIEEESDDIRIIDEELD